MFVRMAGIKLGIMILYFDHLLVLPGVTWAMTL